jgi:hypothetical protein
MSLFSGLELETERPFRVFLNDAAGNPLRDADKNPAYVDVISTDSRKAESLQRARRDRMLSGKRTTAEILDADGIDILAELTMGWYLVRLDGAPLLGPDGKSVPFTVENARSLYASPAAAFITDQVRAGASVRANFMPAPPSA